MADWEVEIQLSNGGIQGGVIGEPESAVVFNTGQVLLGWCRALDETHDLTYLEAIRRAGEFVVNAQDSDGGWRRYSNRDELTTVHAYDVRVSWALLMAYEATKDGSFREAAIRNLEFTLSLQHPNGWFRANALEYKNNTHPLTHTIAYTTRGLLEAGLLLEEDRYIDAARTAAEAVLAKVETDGHLAGELDSEWEAAAPWCCLTGSAQMSIIWLKLFRLTGNSGYLETAKRVNHYLMATQDLESSDDGIRGGIAGPFPVSHGYNRYQILNWATKFFLDALLLEQAAEERAP
jgi:uncharacterized protein YyaL (SSP411 family)